MSRHDDAVEKIIRSTQQTENVKETRADNISGYKDPEPISEQVPDIFFKFQNGKERIVEVDTRPMTEHDEHQDEVFQRSAAAKPNIRSYEHHYAEDII